MFEWNNYDNLYKFVQSNTKFNNFRPFLTALVNLVTGPVKLTSSQTSHSEWRGRFLGIPYPQILTSLDKFRQVWTIIDQVWTITDNFSNKLRQVWTTLDTFGWKNYNNPRPFCTSLNNLIRNLTVLNHFWQLSGDFFGDWSGKTYFFTNFKFWIKG